MIVTKTIMEHISTLVEISKRAFDSDIEVGASSLGGPPEYDSIEWHVEMLRGGHLFTAVDNETIVGGIIIFADTNDDSVMYIGRLFVSPDLFRKGYGVRRHIVGGANRTLFSVDLPPRWCRTGTCRRLQSE